MRGLAALSNRYLLLIRIFSVFRWRSCPTISQNLDLSLPAVSIKLILQAGQAGHYTASRAITSHSTHSLRGFSQFCRLCTPRTSHGGITGIRRPRQHHKGTDGACRGCLDTLAWVVRLDDHLDTCLLSHNWHWPVRVCGVITSGELPHRGLVTANIDHLAQFC